MFIVTVILDDSSSVRSAMSTLRPSGAWSLSAAVTINIASLRDWKTASCCLPPAACFLHSSPLSFLQAAINFNHQHQPEAAREICAHGIARPVRAQISPRHADQRNQQPADDDDRAPQPAALEQHVAEE